MKLFNLTIILFAGAISLFGQNTASNYPVPEYVNVPFYFNPNTNQLSTLERQTPVQSSRPTGPISLETLISVPNMKSDIRFSVNSKPEFVIKISDVDIDPSTIATMYKFKVNPNKRRERREYIVSSATAYAGSTVNTQSLPLTFKKIYPGVYQIKYLYEPGEYFFDIKGSSFIYAFGID